ncbi:PEP-CTERM sorting domain-containing protein [Hahella sp. HN01]|uniref:PEP-CTERM sorting domain-containing protein n=1 Tax=Hahella sp. HN01 TaxID=2847262 RepID=UPI001C1ED69E|nr:PEP-CTERM sorting domain-containing protein [Hahella sp. HN01]MBU6953181.1 PEP-CTERM sorting domain-containing protein [Hahella sp. HN01]
MSIVKKLVFSLSSVFFVTAAHAVPITINDPSYSTSYYESSEVNNDYSLYFIGVYETRRDHSFDYHPTGNANVEIGDQHGKSTTLVLSSYEPTHWNISGLGVTDITDIILYGYHDQSISGFLPSTTVSEYSYEGEGSYQGFTYRYPGDGRVVKHLASQGLTVSSFAGSYRATDFSIGALDPVSVPEPSSIGLLLMGLGLCLGRKLRA